MSGCLAAPCAPDPMAAPTSWLALCSSYHMSIHSSRRVTFHVTGQVPKENWAYDSRWRAADFSLDSGT